MRIGWRGSTPLTVVVSAVLTLRVVVVGWRGSTPLIVVVSVSLGVVVIVSVSLFVAWRGSTPLIVVVVAAALALGLRLMMMRRGSTPFLAFISITVVAELLRGSTSFTDVPTIMETSGGVISAFWWRCRLRRSPPPRAVAFLTAFVGKNVDPATKETLAVESGFDETFDVAEPIGFLIGTLTFEVA